MAKKFNFKRILSLVMAFTMATSLLPMGAMATGDEDGTAPTTISDIGIKSATPNAAANKYQVEIDVPGVDGDAGHDEVILMIDGSSSVRNQWAAMKEAVAEIAETVLNGSGSTKLTLMAFGMGDNVVFAHADTVEEAMSMMGADPTFLLYGRSATNCEVGFTGVADYIENHDDSLRDVQVIYISDGDVNTDETPRAFDTNWKDYADLRVGALNTAKVTFETSFYYEDNYGNTAYAKNRPEAFNTVFGDRFVDATTDEIMTAAFVDSAVTEDDFYAYCDSIWEEVYDHSDLTPGEEYPISVVEHAFVKFDEDNGTHVQELFYYSTFYGASSAGKEAWYPTRVARAADAADTLAAMDEVKAMYVVDYNSYTAWMDTDITSEKSTFVQSNGIAGLCDALEDALNDLASTPFNDVVVTDYMSKWVNLDTNSLKIVDNSTGETIWTVGDGWKITENIPTAQGAPVVVDLVSSDDYAAGGADVDGNTSGDIYKLTWYVKDGAMVRSDSYSLVYDVTVDTAEAGFVYGTDYPANGNTTLGYKDENGGEQVNYIEVPDVVMYSVTYEYTGETPASAPDLPTGGSYLPDASVIVADNPSLDGYTFSGWDSSDLENGKMPAKNVVIKGSWDKIAPPTPTDPVVPEQKIPVNKTADGLDAKDQTNVTLSVPGDIDSKGVDIIYILGGFLSKDQIETDTMIQRLTETFGALIDAGVPVNFGIVPFSSTKDPVMELTTLDSAEDLDALPAQMADAIAKAGNVYDGVNMENALITAKEMFSKSPLADSPGRQHLVMISSGHTYYFNGGENNDYISTVPVKFKKGSVDTDEIFYMEKVWMRARNNSTNSYPIPKAIVEQYKANTDKYDSEWDCYWAYIDQWAKADIAAGDTIVYDATTRAAGNFKTWMNSGKYSSATGSDGKGGTFTYSGYGAVISDPDADQIDGILKFDLDKAGENVGPSPFENDFAAHAISYERAMWEAYTYLQDSITGAGINFYPVYQPLRGADNNYPYSATNGYDYGWYNWTTNYIGHCFMNMLAGGEAITFKSGDTSFFAPIKEEILYSVSAGSYVEDFIGYDAAKGNFEFDQDPATMTLTKGDVKYTAAQITAKEGATSSYAFTAKDASEPTFWLDYYYGNGKDTEKFIWTFGEDVSLAAPVSLTYKLQLTEKATVAGDYEVETNESATLYPKGGTEQKFPVPTVTYTVSGGSTGGGGGGGGGGVVDIPLAPIPEAFTADHYAYIIGYPKDYETGEHTKDQTRMPVMPQGNITRAEVATIFFRLLDDQVRELNMVSENDFSDVNKGQWFNNAISTMASMGIVNGYPDGTFRPNGKITRAEFAAIAARFNASASTDGDYFTDIAGHWGEDEIYKATNSGWIKGYEDNTFKPNQLITRAEAMTLVNRVLHRLPETTDDLHDNMLKWVDNMDTSKWYYLAVQEATNSHDYTRDPSNIDYETWTEMREARDWSELEY